MVVTVTKMAEKVEAELINIVIATCVIATLSKKNLYY